MRPTSLTIMASKPSGSGGRRSFSLHKLKRLARAIGFVAVVSVVFLNIPTIELLLTPRAQLLDFRGEPLAIRSLTTASELCRAQLRNWYGRSLLASHVDDHSTRFDDPRGLFLVFLHADVGKHGDSERLRIHCHVNPGDTMVNYFGVFTNS